MLQQFDLGIKTTVSCPRPILPQEMWKCIYLFKWAYSPADRRSNEPCSNWGKTTSINLVDDGASEVANDVVCIRLIFCALAAATSCLLYWSEGDCPLCHAITVNIMVSDDDNDDDDER